jgi:hypothetical protein
MNRFRQHTTRLFEQHGMKNVIYWTSRWKRAASNQKLVYLLAHDSADAAKRSFDNFVKDPAWVGQVRDDSEKDGKIVSKNRVPSFCILLSFSNIR